MNTLNLNAELFRELSYIADDESSMRKLLKYVKKLAAQQYKTPAPASSIAAEDAVPYRPKTKAELMEDLNEVCEEIPYQGADLGRGLRKVRMSIAAKGKGKI